MCQYEKGLNFETIWSSVFDLDSLDIYRAEGDPRVLLNRNFAEI